MRSTVRLIAALLFPLNVMVAQPQAPQQQSRPTAPKPVFIPVPVSKYQEGLKKLRDNKPKEAEKLFRESLEANPKQPMARLALGELLTQSGDLEGAKAEYDQALALAPEDATVLTLVGKFRTSQKDLAGAEDLFRRAIAADPKSVAAHFELADLLVARNDPAGAMNLYRDVLKFEPDNAKAHYRIGMQLSKENKYKEAVEELMLAARAAPTNPYPYEEVARLYLLNKEYARATQVFARVQVLAPDRVGAYLGRGEALLARGYTLAAITEYNKAIQIDPKFAPSYIKLAVLYQDTGKIQEARAMYGKAIILDPKQAGALNNLAWLSAESRQDLDKVVEWAQEALKLEPNNEQYMDTLAWSYRAKGDTAKALSLYEDLMAKGTKVSEVYYHAAIMYQDMAQTGKAKTALQKALDLNVDFRGVADAKRRLIQIGKG